MGGWLAGGFGKRAGINEASRPASEEEPNLQAFANGEKKSRRHGAAPSTTSKLISPITNPATSA